MKKLMYNTIVIEGIDKTGKDLLGKYLFELDKGKYLHISRGILSCIAYNKLYNRLYEYDLESHQKEVYIYLNINKEDWNIRCKITNEPKINYEQNVEAFEYAKNIIKQYCIVLECNVSDESVYNLATKIIDMMDELNRR